MNVQKSYVDERKSGTLYLVGTPIGNLEDMTFRAIRVLKEVDCIAAEDTRQTRKLLTHYDIQTRLVSYHEHNKHASGPELLRMLANGLSIALVSDAGLPAISDPGCDLVREAVEQHISVVPIPGANAALSALIVSGLPTEQFAFVGFMPRDKKKLTEQLEQIKGWRQTLLIYESPHRIAKTIETMLSVLGNRQSAMARELTKKYEEIARGTLAECLEWLERHPAQGEYCIVLQGNAGVEDAGTEQWWHRLSIEEHVAVYEEKLGDRKEALKLAAKDRGVPKRELYSELVRLK